MLLLLLFAPLILAAPGKNNRDADGSRILFDQRQEGEWNVRADLENFVILVIPTQSSTPATPAAGLTLLDLLSKAAPKRPHRKQAEDAQTQQFIESKTAPYHVDLSTTKDQLHPINAEEIVVAKSPVISLLKSEEARGARAFVLTVPKDETIVIKAKEVDKKMKKKAGLKLLGAENEQCGPGLARDAEGVCRIVN